MENYHKHENQYIYRQQGKVWYLSYSINTQTAKARPFPGPESPSRCRFWLAHLCRPQPTHGGRRGPEKPAAPERRARKPQLLLTWWEALAAAFLTPQCVNQAETWGCLSCPSPTGPQAPPRADVSQRWKALVLELHQANARLPQPARKTASRPPGLRASGPPGPQHGETARLPGSSFW